MDVSNWALFQPVCVPAWVIVGSTVVLMCAAAEGRYKQGFMDGKIQEKEDQMEREENDEM